MTQTIKSLKDSDSTCALAAAELLEAAATRVEQKTTAKMPEGWPGTSIDWAIDCTYEDGAARTSRLLARFVAHGAIHSVGAGLDQSTPRRLRAAAALLKR